MFYHKTAKKLEYVEFRLSQIKLRKRSLKIKRFPLMAADLITSIGSEDYKAKLAEKELKNLIAELLLKSTFPNKNRVVRCI